MPKFSALVYVSDAEPLLARTLDSLRVANDVLVINAENDPAVRELAIDHGARVKKGIPGVTPGAFLMDTFHPWLLVLRPYEQLDDDLKRSLEEWRRRKQDDSSGYAFSVIERSGDDWQSGPPELRLVNRKLINWMGDLPPNSQAPLMSGHLVRLKSEDENKGRAA